MIKIETNEGVTEVSCEGNATTILVDLGIIIKTMVITLYDAGIDDAAEHANFVASTACEEAKRKYKNKLREL